MVWADVDVDGRLELTSAELDAACTGDVQPTVTVFRLLRSRFDDVPHAGTFVDGLVLMIAPDGTWSAFAMDV